MVALAFLIRVSLMLPPPKIWLWTNWSDLQPFFLLCQTLYAKSSRHEIQKSAVLTVTVMCCLAQHVGLLVYSHKSQWEGETEGEVLAPVAVTYVLWVAIGSQPWASPFPSFETLFSWGLDSSHSTDAHLCYAPSSCITVWIIFVINTF